LPPKKIAKKKKIIVKKNNYRIAKKTKYCKEKQTINAKKDNNNYCKERQQQILQRN